MGKYAEDARELLELIGGEGEYWGGFALYDSDAVCFE